MATKKSPSKSSTYSKRKSAKQTKAEYNAHRQMWAVLLFALGVLFAALAFVKGISVWTFFHNLLFGLFGWSSYFIAPILIYISIAIAMDKLSGSGRSNLIKAVVLVCLICGAIQIFTAGVPDKDGFFASAVDLYMNGIAIKGGGLVSGLVGIPLLLMFGKTGASITVILLLFVFIMLITGGTLLGLFTAASKPVKKLEEAYTEIISDERKSPKFNIDVSMDSNSMPEHPVKSPKPAEASLMSKAKQKLMNSVSDTPYVPYSSGNSDADVFTTNSTAIPPSPPISPPTQAELLADGFLQAAASVSDQPQPNHHINTEVAGAFNPELLAVNTEPTSPAIPAIELVDEPIIPSSDTPENTNYINDIVNKFIISDDEGFIAAMENRPSENIDANSVVDTEHISPELRDIAPQEVLEDKLAQPVYCFPPVTLLTEPVHSNNEGITEELKANAQRLVDTLQSFGVQTRIVDISRGPAVTRYELQPSAGVKISKIVGLADDIALNLAAAGVRIEAPIPNKPAVGIEVPNKVVTTVSVREIIDSNEFVDAKSRLTVALGKDITGNIALADIAKMPHMLIAGSTGSGKSVCINTIIMSLLFKSSPDEVKFLMIDPKVVELGVYNGIPHLLVPVVTDPKKAAGALGWAVTEMLNRYKLFADNSVRDLASYNEVARNSDTINPMPQIVIIIDELADLMMAAPNEVEDSICRLAQMARAAGMHLVIATQRPSVDVITGVIKANIPSRIAFAVSSQIDSRTILDSGGAEKLLGRGDMLFYPVGSSKPIRVQGCFVSDKEIEKVISFIKDGEVPDYDQQIIEEIDKQAVVTSTKGGHGEGGGFSDEDEMLPHAIECVVEAGQASTSLLQRRLKLGYARAARIVDEMEAMGIVGPFEGSKPRQVLISKDRWIEMKLNRSE